MASFEVAPAEVANLAHELLREPPRGMQRVRLAVLMARTEGAADLPAVQAKPTSPLHRSAGAADLILIVSATAWAKRTTLGRLALLDHGLSSVRTIERGGRLALDPSGRPRLHKAPRTCASGFITCWHRWGEASIEAEAFADLRKVAPPTQPKPRNKPTDGPRPDVPQPGGI